METHPGTRRGRGRSHLALRGATLLQPAADQLPPFLPIDVQWLMARHLLMLARIEKHRFEQSGQLEAWETLEEACAAFIESEARLG